MITSISILTSEASSSWSRPLRLPNSPRLRAVTGHVGEHTGCVVRNLKKLGNSDLGRKTHLDAIAVRVEEESKLLDKLPRHQFVTKLWHLVQKMIITVMLTIMMMTMMAMAMMRHLGNVPEQAHHVAQQVGFLREPLLALRTSWYVLYECKMYGITSGTFNWWMG